MMMRATILLVCALTAVVTACGGSGPAATGQPQATATQPDQPQATPVPPGEPTVPAGDPGASGMTVVHLEIQSGPLAGTYDATGEKSDCNTSSTGSGATYLDLDKTEGLTGLTFVSAEGGTTPGLFYFQALFGALGATQDFLEISALDPTSATGGSGTTQLEDKGATIKWTLNGMTADGVALVANIECGPVDRR